MDKTKTSTLKRMLKHIRDNDPGLFGAWAIYTVIAVAVPFVSVMLPRVLINYITGEAPNVWGLIRLVLAFFLAGALLNFLKEFISSKNYPHFSSLRIEYVRDLEVKLLGMDYKYVESAEFYEKNTRAMEAPSNNDNGIEGIYHRLFSITPNLFLILALGLLVGLKSPFILAAMVLHAVASTLVALAVQKYEYSRRRDEARATRRANYYSSSSTDFACGKDVRMYDLKGRVLDNFKLEIKGYSDVIKAIKNKEYKLGFITLAALLISDIATYGTLTLLCVQGMSIADYSMYIAAAASLNIQINELSEGITFIMRELVYVRDYYELIDSDLGENDSGIDAVPLGIPLEIEFEHVSFRYPGAAESVFDDLSLKIPAGQKLALVGVNGAGKTTFVKLLTGLFRPDSGRVLINGRDAGEYRRSALYSMFAAVFQEVNILAFTVAQNIACCLDGFDRERIDAVLKQVGLYEKVMSLPHGVDTMMLKIIEEDGAVFSGGENQKLAIARALYKGGNCVIMDEPTSALDALAEEAIYSEFDELTKGRTAIYISHRLASTRFCDEIVLLDGKQLREYGTHDELMELNGIYHEMFVTQGKYYREGGAEQ